MHVRSLLAASLLGVAAGGIAIGSRGGQEIVREEHSVIVGGITEHWRLVWESAPAPACGPRDDMWSTCPCAGFAYGEMGRLDLVRERPGHEKASLPLTPLFTSWENPAAVVGKDLAVLQRWPVLASDTWHDTSATFAARVNKRAAVPAMRLGDYDHDGRATEFMLEVGAGPCGHVQAIVIGLPRGDSTLRPFSSLARPREPLVLERHSWELLLHGKGEIVSNELSCGDHGADIEIDIYLRPTARGIDAKRLTYQCTAAMQRGRLKSSEPI